MTVSYLARPVSECDGSQVTKEWEVVVKIAYEPGGRSRVIETSDGGEVETMKGEPAHVVDLLQ